MPLIDVTKSYDLVYKWFAYLKTKGHPVTAYVIMPNHIHVIICFRESEKSINKIISDGKRFLSYGIVERLKGLERTDLLQICREAVTVREKECGTKYKVFKRSFDMKECFTEPFLRQKVEYIHNNPISKKWSLAADAESYLHSSARFYATDLHELCELVNYGDL